jgi:D-alanyl-D-alanine carboxypeptidase
MRLDSIVGSGLRRRLRPATVFLCLSLGAAPAAAVDRAADAPPVPVKGPYILVDAATGRVLDHFDARRPWFPASTSKLMTVYVTFRAVASHEITLESTVTISQNAAATPPSKMGFRPGTELTLDAALKIMMVKSANDLAVAVAETVAGSVAAFADRMNAEAARLGMSRSHFVNPHGLPDSRQVSSARDMALLAQTLLAEFPEYRDYFRVPAIQVGDAVMKNFNPLLDRFPGASGMKTGFICSSGFNLVASAKRGDRELIAVVFGEYGGRERAEHAAALLDEGFRIAEPVTSPPITLATVSSGAEYAEPLDMRPLICSPKRATTASDAAGADAKDGESPQDVSHLIAPIYLGPPQEIFVSEPSAVIAGGFPQMPIRRPERVYDLPEAGIADAFAPLAVRPDEPNAAIGSAVGAPQPLHDIKAR